MRCRSCSCRAEWWRRVCADCRRLRATVISHRDEDVGALMDRLAATGVSYAKIERFLDADLDGTGSVRDQLAAAMTNELLAIFGHRNRQTAADVRHIRERGSWKLRGQRPEGLL